MVMPKLRGFIVSVLAIGMLLMLTAQPAAASDYRCSSGNPWQCVRVTGSGLRVSDIKSEFRINTPQFTYYQDYINHRLWIDLPTGTDTYVWGYIHHPTCVTSPFACDTYDFGQGPLVQPYPKNTRICVATYRNADLVRITNWACIPLT